MNYSELSTLANAVAIITKGVMLDNLDFVGREKIVKKTLSGYFKTNKNKGRLNQMALTEIKSKFAGQCEKCGRELRQGWNIFYDNETKKTYCTKCGKELSGNNPAIANNSTAIDPAKILERFTQEEIDADPALSQMQADMVKAQETQPATIKNVMSIALEVNELRIDVIDVLSDILQSLNDIKKELKIEKPAEKTAKKD